MATYEELFNLSYDTVLAKKVEIALVINAQAVIDNAGSTTADKKWAVNVLTNATVWSKKTLLYVLAKNNTLDATSITSATDTAIQTAVDNVVPTLSAIFNGA